MSTALTLVTSRRTRPAFAGQPRFRRTANMALVREILTHPKVYPFISEQNSPHPDDFYPISHEAIWYVMAYDGDERLGCYAFYPENSACWGIHCALLPHAGWVPGRTVAVTKALFRWIWENTDCQRIIAKVPAFNTLALRLAQKSQMIEFGRNVRSFPKFGALHDEVLLGISRPGAK